MDNYKWQLQKYSGRNSRHTCPACGRPHCFTLYVDAAGNPLASDVGRCEHLSKCGFHKTPAEHFADHPNEERKPYSAKTGISATTKKQPEQIDFIPFSLIHRSESTSNSLMRYLAKSFPQSGLEMVTKMYHLGSTRKGEIIYPQIDAQGRCRTGKVMAYGEDGHRIKRSECDAVDWLHARLMRQQGKTASDYHLRQCLFGEHLLTKYPYRIACLTEGEKSAVIASLFFPQFVWVSCGGKFGLKPETCKSLAGRDVIVYADAAVKDAVQHLNTITFNDKIPDWDDEGTSLPEEMVLITQSFREVEQIMSTYVGIVRSNLRLTRAMKRLEILYRETEDLFERSVVSREICELRNVISVAYLIIKQNNNN